MDMRIDKTFAIVGLRILLGWFMLADGLVNALDPHFTAQAFLMNAKTFPAFYAWFAQPMNLWWVDPLNVWGIMLVGAGLLLGVAIRPAAWAGFVLMILYYFPHYTLPYVDHGYIVDDHLIYAAVFALIALAPEAQRFSLNGWIRRSGLPLSSWL